MYGPIPPSPAPVLTLDSQKIEAFESLFLQTRRLGPGAVIDYNITSSKHEFLRYLADRKQILLHGSNYPDLNVLSPRLSTDTRAAAMNRESVFAVADGILPMFFAIWDRENYVGHVLNGAYRLPDTTGLATNHYFFSLNEEMLQLSPFRDGWVYLLPRDKFKLAANGYGVVLEEWISQEPVQVLAKLSISPKDFPLLDAIGGHDEIELEWLAETSKICSGAVKEHNELRSGYSFRFPGGPEWATRLAWLCRLHRKYCPFLGFELIGGSSNGPIYLKVTGPDGTKQLIRCLLDTYSRITHQ